MTKAAPELANRESELTDTEKDALRQFVYQPQRASANYVQAAKAMRDNGIKMGCVLDKYIIPARPGKVTAVLGRPGMGKTSYMAAIGKAQAKEIVRLGLQDKEYVAFVTWETPVEELEAFFQELDGYNVSDLAWGRVPDDALIEASIKRPELPIWTIGNSITETSIESDPMIVEKVYRAIVAIYKEYGLKPRVILADYIQKIPIERAADKIDKVSRAVAMIRRLSVALSTPVFLGCQARQVVDDRDRPIPTMRDAEWSSTILQDADCAISVWRPIRTFLPSERPTIEVPHRSGNHYTNDDNLMVVRLLKQRWESGSGEWAINMDMSTLEISDRVLVDISNLGEQLPPPGELDSFAPLLQ